MQSLERVLAQESCRCVAVVAVVCRSCGVPVSRLHSECTHALCCDERSGRPHGGGWQADERLYISCLHSKVLCRCVLCCRVVCGCGCLAPWRSVTDHRADSCLTRSRTRTNTNTRTHTLSHELSSPPPMLVALLSSLGRRCHAVVWFAWHRHHAAHAELVILTDHLALLSLFSSPLFALSGCILVDIASTGDRTTCNHTFKQPHSLLLLQRQRFVASIPQFTWWYWLVLSHALVHSLHLLLCSRMNPRDVALYQSFVCLLAASIQLLSLMKFQPVPDLLIRTYQDSLPASLPASHLNDQHTAKLRTRDLGLA